MERKRYSKEFRQQTVERMNACDNITGLSRELGISRNLLYYWRYRSNEPDPPPARSREFNLRKQIIKLKRLLANKTMEVDWFFGVPSDGVLVTFVSTRGALQKH